MKYDILLNAVNLKCPLPILKAKKEISLMPVGGVLLVKTTDPQTKKDFKYLSSLNNVTLLALEEKNENNFCVYYFYLQKHI